MISYFDGESRVEASTGKSHLIIAFEGASSTQPNITLLKSFVLLLVVNNVSNVGYSDINLFSVYASTPSASIITAFTTAATAVEQMKAVGDGVSEQVVASTLPKPSSLLSLASKPYWIIWKPLTPR
ncbi:hypothetical protein BDA99DRAFT_606588 [Phascolomyces articulosus]|uniref:Uncharacterized protein n=1 Tax=Phascolomyces articulosus TaxID=60185 RepID=A0AAD5PDT3_9FUNG|nr:hypothetical protein BDA99DRAFT_606588 [Phascolomyces articulosus]